MELLLFLLLGLGGAAYGVERQVTKEEQEKKEREKERQRLLQMAEQHAQAQYGSNPFSQGGGYLLEGATTAPEPVRVPIAGPLLHQRSGGSNQFNEPCEPGLNQISEPAIEPTDFESVDPESLSTEELIFFEANGPFGIFGIPKVEMTDAQLQQFTRTVLILHRAYEAGISQNKVCSKILKISKGGNKDYERFTAVWNQIKDFG